MALQFLVHHGVKNVPQWIDGCPGYALLEWIDGELANPPTAEELQQAVQFIATIKDLSLTPDTKSMPLASEACTSGLILMDQIQKRVKRLSRLSEHNIKLKQFMDRFITSFETAYDVARANYAANNLAFDQPLQTGRCLIPADFGFHNAIRGRDGKLTFIDFEYFGWDDPTKLTADFLLHPAMQLSSQQRHHFYNSMLEVFGDDPTFSSRLKALLPIFALRWALILLNEFLPEKWSGRAFARDLGEWENAKERQLKKASDLLKRVEEDTLDD
jgi:thiamine kinase-like enzyme